MTVHGQVWLRGTGNIIYQHMPVKVRLEGQEELLRGSSHVEEPHHTVSPAAQRHSRVFLWGPVRTASGMYTIYGIPCFAAPSGGGFLGNRFEDIKMYLNLSYNSWLATDSDYFYDSRNRWLL